MTGKRKINLSILVCERVSLKALIMLCIGIASVTSNMKAMRAKEKLICTCATSPRVITSVLTENLEAYSANRIDSWLDRKVIAELVCKGADPNVLYFGTPFIARFLHDYEMTKFLLAHNADPNKKSTWENDTVLHRIMDGSVNVSCLPLFSKHKADVNALDIDDNTPLHKLAENCRWYSENADVMLEKADWLCRHRASLRTKNKAGKTAYEVVQDKISEAENKKEGIAPAKILAIFLAGVQTRGLSDVLP
jgi:hypothetical protein